MQLLPHRNGWALAEQKRKRPVRAETHRVGTTALEEPEISGEKNAASSVAAAAIAEAVKAVGEVLRAFRFDQ